VLLVPLAALLAPGAIWSRVTMGVGSGANEVTAGRTNEIWAPLMPELFKSPIWGDGLGSILWSNAMLEGRLPQVAHPHNAYLAGYHGHGAHRPRAADRFWIYRWRDFRRLPRTSACSPSCRASSRARPRPARVPGAGFAGSSLAPAPAQAFMWLAFGVMFGVSASSSRAWPREEGT
jgi:hypothetical protein